MSQGMKELHTYGTTLKTRWVLVHDTDKDGTDAVRRQRARQGGRCNAAQAAGERPVFRPGTDFSEFVFTETGDTNAKTEAGAEYGGLRRGPQAHPGGAVGATEGEITLVFRGDVGTPASTTSPSGRRTRCSSSRTAATSCTSQRNALDSGYVIDVTADYSKHGRPAGPLPRRGSRHRRDDRRGLVALPDTGFQNDGDNEITGIHVSDGDASPVGLLGAKVPTPFENGWRVF